jgi:hypothetical protein
MRTGWIAKIENPQSQDRIFTLIACSRAKALARCAELRLQHVNMKIELVGPYSEVLETQREVKTLESQDLNSLFKEYADFNPLLISREGRQFKIELDKVD